MTEHSMKDFTPFADDTASITVGGLTIENGTDRLAIYGTSDLTRDKPGLAIAKELRAFLDAAIKLMETQGVPDKVAPPIKTVAVKNPFV